MAEDLQDLYGQAEARALFGKEPRQFEVLTKRFVDDGSGGAIVLTVNTSF